MRICRYLHNGLEGWGVLEENRIIPLPVDFFPAFFDPLSKTQRILPVDEIHFLLPVNPSKIVCVGRNYADHAAELGNAVPAEPMLFLKAPSSLILHREAIILPVQSERVEHEAELGVIIGADCSKLSESEDPFEYILGYCCLNDVTARDLQKKDVQFTRAKSFDTFCPIGHFIETDLDVSDIGVTCRINHEIKQTGRTSRMVFPVGFLIRYISNQMTLKAGDLIATGTPSGVSKLSSGDICEVEIEGLGRLVNPII